MKKVVLQIKRTLSAVLAVMMVLTAVPQTAMQVLADDPIENVYVDDEVVVDELENVYVADEKADERVTVSFNAISGNRIKTLTVNGVANNNKFVDVSTSDPVKVQATAAPGFKIRCDLDGVEGVVGEGFVYTFTIPADKLTDEMVVNFDTVFDSDNFTILTVENKATTEVIGEITGYGPYTYAAEDDASVFYVEKGYECGIKFKKADWGEKNYELTLKIDDRIVEPVDKGDDTALFCEKIMTTDSKIAVYAKEIVKETAKATIKYNKESSSVVAILYKEQNLYPVSTVDGFRTEETIPGTIDVYGPKDAEVVVYAQATTGYKITEPAKFPVKVKLTENCAELEIKAEKMPEAVTPVPLVTSLTINGGKNEVTMFEGGIAEYAIGVTPTNAFSNVEIVDISGGGIDRYRTYIDTKTKKLVVYSSYINGNETGCITLSDTKNPSEPKEIQLTVHVDNIKLEGIELKDPVVIPSKALYNSTTIKIERPTLPIEDAKYRGVTCDATYYYDVTISYNGININPYTSNHDVDMKNKTQEIKIWTSSDPNNWRYISPETPFDIIVKIVRFDEYYGDTSTRSTNPVRTSYAKAKYEQNLKLTKKATTIYQDMDNILVAVPKFSNGTTATQLSKVELLDAYGNSFPDKLEIDPYLYGGESIYLKNCDGLDPGKYTVKATALCPDSISEPSVATVTINIEDRAFEIVCSQSRIYKLFNKKVDVKFKTVGADNHKDIGGRRLWAISEVNGKRMGEPGYELPAGITINTSNGTITLAKGVNIPETELKVAAIYTDGKDTYYTKSLSESKSIRISSKSVDLYDVVIAEFDDPYYNATNVKRYKAVKENSIYVGGNNYFALPVNKDKDAGAYYYEEDIASFNDVSVKCNKKWMSDEGYFIPNGAGKAKFTATALDGSKKSVSKEITAIYNTTADSFGAMVENSNDEYVDLIKDKSVSINGINLGDKFTVSYYGMSGDDEIDPTSINTNASVTNANVLSKSAGELVLVATSLKKDKKGNYLPIKITITDKGKKGGASTSFEIDIYSKNAANKLDGFYKLTNSILYANYGDESHPYNQTVSFNALLGTKNANSKAPDNYKIEITVDQAAKNKAKNDSKYAYEKLEEKFKALGKQNLNSITLNTGYQDEDNKGLVAGKYSVYVQIFDSEGVAVTRPTAYTLKLDKYKAWGKLNVKSKYKMISGNAVPANNTGKALIDITANKKDKNTDGFFALNILGSYVDGVNLTVKNANVGGNYNEFNKNFKAVKEDGKWYLKYIGKKDLNDLFINAKTLEQKDAKKKCTDYVKTNFTGYITYDVYYGETETGVAKHETKTIKVTVEVKNK